MSSPIGIIEIGLDPVLVRLGPLSVHWYGLMYVVGLSTGLAILTRYAIDKGYSRETVYEFFWPILIACLVGGRLYYVVQSNLGWYLKHPQNILATWEGGMAFYGAVFAGVITAFVLAWKKGMPFGDVLDISVLLITPAQVIGRIGNVINGDIIGYASTLPWAVRYTNPHNTFVPSHTTAYQPASAYELLFSLALFVLVWRLRFRLRPPGTLFVLWLTLYSVGQFLLFFGRANVVVLFGLKQAQLTAIVVVGLAVPVWLLWQRRHSTYQADLPPPGATPVPPTRIADGSRL